MMALFMQSGEELSQMEKRDIFSLYCLDLESQLVHINLVQIPTMFQVLANVQVAGHSEVRLPYAPNTTPPHTTPLCPQHHTTS